MQDSLAPGRLWSLLDMLKINAREFYRNVLNIHSAQLLVEERNKSNQSYSETIIDPRIVDHLLGRAKTFRDHAVSFGATVTVSMAEEHIFSLESRLKPSLEEVVSVYRNLISTLEHELSGILFFSIESGRKKYLEPAEPVFGAEFLSKFPTAGAFELDEAAKCFALQRSTASVFHLMRLMEIGIRAVARCLDISDPLKPADRNWGKILKDIKFDLDSRCGASSSKSWKNNKDREFFENAYVSLDAVRVAWRNTTMHVENKYTDEEAEHIFLAVKGFMKNLASICDENGDPKVS